MKSFLRACRHKKYFLWGGGVLAVLALSVVLLFSWSDHAFKKEGPLLQSRTMVIARGATLSGISNQLKAAGIIDNVPFFKVTSRFLKLDRALKAGEYAFPAKVSLKTVLHILEEGKTVLHKVTIPEGLTSFQVVEILLQQALLTGKIKAIPSEGSLLPETYLFSRGDSRQSLVNRMKRNLKKELQKRWKGQAPFKNWYEAVILASIVEKETPLSEERAKIAGVFLNRLQRRMRLQSDPTVIYALTQGRGNLDRRLSRKDLKIESPYNTYHVFGLPPTPITNVSVAALAAVLSPEKHDYLYFVANGTGGHNFARTLKAHNKNVARWRRHQKQTQVR